VIRPFELSAPALRLALVGLAAAAGVLAGINPVLGVSLAVGLVIVGVFLADVTVGLCVFAGLSFLEILPSAGGLTIFKLVGALLVVSTLAAASTRRRRGLLAVHPLLAVSLILFVAWAALGILWAESVSAATGSVVRYVLNLALFPIAWVAVWRREHVNWLVITLVFGTAIAAAYGLVSPPSHPPAIDTADAARATGTIGDANQFAAVLVAGLSLALSLALAPVTNFYIRAGALLTAVMCVMAIFLTLSRGGLVALAVAMFASVAMGGRWRRVIGSLALLVLLGSIVYFTSFASVPAQQRISTISGGTGRTDLWTVGWRMVQAKPVAGIGTGNFQTSSIHYLLRPGATQRADFIVDTPKVAHNTYLQILAELGIVGFVLFAVIVTYALVCIARAARAFARSGDLQMEILARGLFIGLIGLMTADFFISEMYSKLLWLLLATGPPLLMIAQRGATESGGGADNRSRWAT
jgi:putative inorganic carbon (hco3(-)) transporter